MSGRSALTTLARVAQAAALLLVGTSLYGCWPARRHIEQSHVRVLPGALAEGDRLKPIRGLRAAVDSGGPDPVRVLVVHGMRTWRAGYSATLQRGLAADRLKLSPRDSVEKILLQRAYQLQVSAAAQPQAAVTLPESELRRRAWYDPATGRDRLVFYELLWAPTRDAIKDRFLGCFESGPGQRRRCPTPGAERNQDRRALLNGQLKDGVMVDGFGDATVVLGPAGDLLRDDLDLAFCIIGSEILHNAGVRARRVVPGERCDMVAGIRSADRPRANEALRTARIFGITHSLGSFLVMDAHQRYFLADAMRRGRPVGADGDTSRWGTAVRDSLDNHRAESLFFMLDDLTVFMRANQVSLLGLARLQPGCFGFRGENVRGARCPNRNLPILDQTAAASAGAYGQHSQWAAFNDVNDMLGFELPPYLGGSEPFGTLVNVSVSNPHRWSLPFVYKNPLDVHTRSDGNPAVLDAIVNGILLTEYVPPMERSPRPRGR